MKRLCIMIVKRACAVFELIYQINKCAPNDIDNGVLHMYHQNAIKIDTKIKYTETSIK